MPAREAWVQCLPLASQPGRGTNWLVWSHHPGLAQAMPGTSLPPSVTTNRVSRQCPMSRHRIAQVGSPAPALKCHLPSWDCEQSG